MPIPEQDLPDVLALANRFEAIAADGFAGKPFKERLAALIKEARGRPTIAAGTKIALGVMITAIEDTAPAGRFARKIAILREAEAGLAP